MDDCLRMHCMKCKSYTFPSSSHYHTRTRCRDPTHFKSAASLAVSSSTDNWVIRHTALKKLFRLLTGYYQSSLRQNVEQCALELPNLQVLAKGADSAACNKEAFTFGRLVLNAALQCPKNAVYVERVQGLDQTVQHQVMAIIEGVRRAHSRP